MNKKNIKEAILYLFFGGLTTLVDLVVHFLLDKPLGKDLYYVSATIAWVAAVAFAFVVNKLWVFESKSWEKRIARRELVEFVSARVFSLLVELAGMSLMIEILGMKSREYSFAGYVLAGSDVAKLVMQVVVVILNYFFSKLVIFKKKK